MTRNIVAWIVALLLAAACLAFVPDPLHARVGALAAFCLTLWLSEVTAPFVPTLVLVVGAPLLLGPLDARVDLARVLSWAADPVLALFFGGFALAAAAQARGVDRVAVGLVMRAAHGDRRRLVLLVLGATAFLSMWISNIAAAALMLASLRPLLASTQGEADALFKRALLIAIAFGANFGGMATPVGTGPNAIAIAALANRAPITFAHWVAFALPLTLLVLATTAVFVLVRFRVRGTVPLAAEGAPVASAGTLDRGGRAVVAVFVVTVALWLLEPLHGVPSAVVAMGAAAMLFASGLLQRADLGKIDWSTLLLVAGGIVLGRVLEAGNVFTFIGDAIQATALPPTVQIFVLVLGAALMSAIMSNTATATLLVPLAMSIDASSATPILVAIGCSFGVPFVVSTPQNAMAVGAGLPSKDLLQIGLPLMVAGAALVVLTGRFVLATLGVR
jgi:sodium-dependent dicarboxylate transporter 2/3/5